jgi:hypothetical protein
VRTQRLAQSGVVINSREGVYPSTLIQNDHQAPKGHQSFCSCSPKPVEWGQDIPEDEVEELMRTLINEESDGSKIHDSEEDRHVPQTYYEVEGAVFRKAGGPMEVYVDRTGEWKKYEGDPSRVFRLSNPMTLEEVKPYMEDVENE